MFTAFQRIAFLSLLSLVAVTPCLAQPGGGGGPGGTGDIEITDMTFSSSTAKLTVKYRLAHDFKSSPTPFATVINDGAVVKIQELDDYDANPSPAAVYTVDIPMGAHGEGDYQLTIAYDADFPDMPDTMTLDFSIDSADDVDQGSAAYPLTHIIFNCGLHIVFSLRHWCLQLSKRSFFVCNLVFKGDLSNEFQPFRVAG